MHQWSCHDLRLKKSEIWGLPLKLSLWYFFFKVGRSDLVLLRVQALMEI